MSFDLHFQPFRYDGTTERRKNPFTNQVQEFPRNLPLSKAEVDAVLAALQAAGAEPSGDEGYLFRSADGASVEIHASDIASGCMFAIRGAGVTPQLARLLFDVMVAGNWVIVGTADDDVVIAPNEACMKGPPSNSGRTVVVSSGEEVRTLVSGGSRRGEDIATRSSLDPDAVLERYPRRSYRGSSSQTNGPAIA